MNLRVLVRLEGRENLFTASSEQHEERGGKVLRNIVTFLSNYIEADPRRTCYLFRIHHHHHHHHVPEGLGVFLFLDPRDEVGPSISSSVVLCSFVLLVYIVVLVLVVSLCPSSVHAVATFTGTVLFHLLCSVLPFFALKH